KNTFLSFRTEHGEERNLSTSVHSDEPDFSLSLEMTVLVQLPGLKFHPRSNRVQKRGGPAGFPPEDCGNDGLYVYAYFCGALLRNPSSRAHPVHPDAA
ncbi:MAG: hypothetical protein AB2L11_13300, partial [Syntrophobacteraceae bacterium]